MIKFCFVNCQLWVNISLSSRWISQSGLLPFDFSICGILLPSRHTQNCLVKFNDTYNSFGNVCQSPYNDL